MNEYNVSYYATEDGGFVLDVHSSTGTSPYLKFKSPQQMRKFLASQGLHEERLAEIDAISANLKPGHGYHEQMFLPDSVLDAIEKLISETGGLVDTQIPDLQLPVRPNGHALEAASSRP